MSPRAKNHSPDIQRHLKALGLSDFAITLTGPLYRSTRVLSLGNIPEHLNDIAHRNDRARQRVFVHGVDDQEHDLVLIGPSRVALTKTLRAAGHDPAAVVEVGPEHFESWIRLGEPVPYATRRVIAEYLNWHYRIEPYPGHAPKHGFLAGFLVRQPDAKDDTAPEGSKTGARAPKKRILVPYPRVRLCEATGNVATQGRELIRTAAELQAEMSAAIDRDLMEDYEAEQADVQTGELVLELSRLWVEAYENTAIETLDALDQSEVLHAFNGGIPRELVEAALGRAATRKGSLAGTYAVQTVAAIYESSPDGDLLSP